MDPIQDYYRLQLLYEQTVMEYFYDNPELINERIRNQYGAGLYRIMKYDAKSGELIDWYKYEPKLPCDCSLQRILLRGCQNPNHT
jgi:hypothetical protein